MTEAERAYQPMEGRKPSAEQLANPLRSLAGRPVRAKRVDLGVQGESDEVMASGEPKGVESYEVSDIYPEAFEGAAAHSPNPDPAPHPNPDPSLKLAPGYLSRTLARKPDPKP